MNEFPGNPGLDEEQVAEIIERAAAVGVEIDEKFITDRSMLLTYDEFLEFFVREKIPGDSPYIDDDVLMCDVDRIWANPNINIEAESDLAEVVEYPVRDACADLWMKGVETVWSNANYTSVGGMAGVMITQLSDENLEIAQGIFPLFCRLIDQESRTYMLCSPCGINNTVGDVRLKMIEMAERFVSQV